MDEDSELIKSLGKGRRPSFRYQPLTKRRCISPSKHAFIQKNLETFKENFQKPSQIYKFMKETWKTKPLYLHRTLSYIRRNRHLPNCSGVCFYNWICTNPEQTSQKTKSFGYNCPWCDREYKHMESLMIHLRCCHLRFNFNVVQEDGCPVIEMTLNASFDGSYCGFKYPGHDLRHDFRFTPRVPERRRPLTQVIFFRPKNSRYGMLENNIVAADGEPIGYADDEADVDVCSGRLYYHTSTCLPVKPNEVDIDSEADMDPDWLKERTQLMIDEFTDVNEGEKEMLKLWNLHMMKYRKCKSDHFLLTACLDFVRSHGATILSKNLYKNFVLHLANLYDFGLLSSYFMLEIITMLNNTKAKACTESRVNKFIA